MAAAKLHKRVGARRQCELIRIAHLNLRLERGWSAGTGLDIQSFQDFSSLKGSLTER